MKRWVVLVYGLLCYIVFFAVLLRAIWFVFTMDRTPGALTRPFAARLLINCGLLTVFALQHSIMARQWFKRAWTRFIPVAAERSTYVLFSCLALLLLMRFWQPFPAPIWRVENPLGVGTLCFLFFAGWGLALLSTFLIDHLQLFGLKQVWCFFTGKDFQRAALVTSGPYLFVRHPIYLGTIIAFWSTPTLTAGHLFFAMLTTGYILAAIPFEERDILKSHGELYRRYRYRVSAFTPLPRKRPP